MSKQSANEFAKVMLFIRHVRNNYEMQPAELRFKKACAAEYALERALGKKGMDALCASDEWAAAGKTRRQRP